MRKGSNTAAHQRRKIPLGGAIVPAGGDVLVHEVWDIREVTDVPLGNAHVLEDRLELCLVHLVEANVVRAAQASVLPREIDDWTCKPDIAAQLSRAVVLCCCFLLGDDEGREI